MRPTPTYFDVLLTAAASNFAEHKVDIAGSFETGLVADSIAPTSSAHPGTAITSSAKITWQAARGGNLAQMLKEKAGIFKTGPSPARNGRPGPCRRRSRDPPRRRKRSARCLDIAGKSIELAIASNPADARPANDLPKRRQQPLSSTLQSAHRARKDK